MEDLKIGFVNFFALGISISQANPMLQSVSLILAVVYTSISIYKKIK
tara:strand:- start:57 stop:197 length:141 start_codon:yes stop_codon:yes gene_type:complete